MLIREYTPADRETCLHIFTSNIPTFFALHELGEFEEWLDDQDSLYKQPLSQVRTNYYYVVEQQDNVIACGGFYLPEQDGYATMVWGMVDHALHKQGIGRKLLEYRISTIRLLKPSAQIALDTTQHSYKFFEKYGFKTTKVTNDYYAKGLDRYDMVR